MKNLNLKLLLLLATIGFSSTSIAFFGFFEDEGVAEAAEAAQQAQILENPEYNIDRIPDPHKINHQTIPKDLHFLKANRSEIILILHSFQSLEDNLSGYEEKMIVQNLKNYFKDKYLITQMDLIEIKRNLNESMDIVKDKRNADR